MAQRYCHYVNPAGVLCGGPPLKDREYCHWHLHESGRRMKAARARARGERVILKFPVLDDQHAVQVGVMQVLEALAHSELDHRTAQLMLSALRLASSNLKSDRGWHQKSELQTFGFEPRIRITDPGFESQYDLPEDFDLSVDPEVAFPPPEHSVGAQSVPQVRDLPLGANLGDDADTSVTWITADQVELMEIRQNEGHAAATKFADQMVRNDQRRERRQRRARYEEMARHQTIKLAAHQLLEEELRAGRLTPGMSAKEAWEALTQPKAETSRKPPQSAEAVSNQGESAAKVGA